MDLQIIPESENANDGPQLNNFFMNASPIEKRRSHNNIGQVN